MRVITGTARGRKLGQLQGMDTRPTTDQVKESIFNIIQFDIEGRRVLDLFAGTGQLGIEALSRGAAGCTFVDQRRDAAALVRSNLKRPGPGGPGGGAQFPRLGPGTLPPGIFGSALSDRAAGKCTQKDR